MCALCVCFLQASVNVMEDGWESSAKNHVLMIAMARTVNFTAGAMVTRYATRQLASVRAGQDLKDLAALRNVMMDFMAQDALKVVPILTVQAMATVPPSMAPARVTRAGLDLTAV